VRCDIQYMTPDRTTLTKTTAVSFDDTMEALVRLKDVLCGTLMRVLAGFSHPA
jgi:hypothetical protein